MIEPAFLIILMTINLVVLNVLIRFTFSVTDIFAFCKGRGVA